jgi:hypothetical protein
LDALEELRGGEVDRDGFIGGYVESAAKEVRGLVVTTPPDELPGAVARLCSRWEEVRVASVVDSILGVA